MSSYKHVEPGTTDLALLDRERRRVLALLRQAVPFTAVLELGSPALDRILGKQDIDILVRAPADRFQAARDILDGLFARNPDQLSAFDFQGYVAKSPFEVTVQLTAENGRFDDFAPFLMLLDNDAEIRLARKRHRPAWGFDDLTWGAFPEMLLARQQIN